MTAAHPLDQPLHALACDRHPPGDEALAFAWERGEVERLTFGQVAEASKALAERLAGAGVGPRIPVAVVLPQSPLSPVLHLALSRLGAVGVPLSPLFGPDGLAPRLHAAKPALAIVHHEKVAAVREADPDLPVAASDGTLALGELPAARPAQPLPGGEDGEAPLHLIFTSGTTAQPKAALLPHRVIAGRMQGFALAHPGFPHGGDRFWSPADWAWIGGLHDALLAPWLEGVPVFAYERRGPFDPARADALLREHGVRNAFLPPTALRLWMRSGASAPPLRTLHTAGEPLPEAVHAWAAKAFGAPPREVYGLTECAFLVVNADGQAGFTGRAAPPHGVGVVRQDGAPCRSGEVGEVSVRSGSPTMMLGYLRDGALELPLDHRGWLRTGDLARKDHRGVLVVLGRGDDVVKVAGHRVAPREVEEELLRHPQVEECAVVGVQDEVKGHALRAYVVAAKGADPAALPALLQGWVRQRLAAHLVPRDVALVEALPRTTSGKVRRKDLA